MAAASHLNDAANSPRNSCSLLSRDTTSARQESLCRRRARGKQLWKTFEYTDEPDMQHDGRSPSSRTFGHNQAYDAIPWSPRFVGNEQIPRTQSSAGAASYSGPPATHTDNKITEPFDTFSAINPARCQPTASPALHEPMFKLLGDAHPAAEAVDENPGTTIGHTQLTQDSRGNVVANQWSITDHQGLQIGKHNGYTDEVAGIDPSPTYQRRSSLTNVYSTAKHEADTARVGISHKRDQLLVPACTSDSLRIRDNAVANPSSHNTSTADTGYPQQNASARRSRSTLLTDFQHACCANVPTTDSVPHARGNNGVSYRKPNDADSHHMLYSTIHFDQTGSCTACADGRRTMRVARASPETSSTLPQKSAAKAAHTVCAGRMPQLCGSQQHQLHLEPGQVSCVAQPAINAAFPTIAQPGHVESTAVSRQQVRFIPATHSSMRSEVMLMPKQAVGRSVLHDEPWQRRPVPILRSLNSSIATPLQPQDFRGPFFADVKEHDSDLLNTLWPVDDSHDCRINNWWGSGNNFARQTDFYNRLQAASRADQDTKAVTAPVAGVEDRDTDHSATKQQVGFDLGRLMLPLVENLTSYVDFSLGSRRTHFCCWKPAPEWAVDRSTTGDNSFFDPGWCPTSRIGRDSRYRVEPQHVHSERYAGTFSQVAVFHRRLFLESCI